MGRLDAMLLHVQISLKLDMEQTCSIDVSGVKYSHFMYLVGKTIIKNCLLVVSPVLRCQFQNSILAMMWEQIKVGFHLLNLTYSQTSYLEISWSIN